MGGNSLAEPQLIFVVPLIFSLIGGNSHQVQFFGFLL